MKTTTLIKKVKALETEFFKIRSIDIEDSLNYDTPKKREGERSVSVIIHYRFNNEDYSAHATVYEFEGKKFNLDILLKRVEMKIFEITTPTKALELDVVL